MALFIWLKNGIYANELTFGQYKVDGLYIKLNKKLILKANKVTIPKSKTKPSFNNTEETFDKIKHLFTYFEYIDLNEIEFKNNQFKFLFADNILYIVSDDYEIAGNIEKYGTKLIADVSLLYLKKEKINIVGKLKYFLDKERLETEGTFDAYNIKGDFSAYKDNEDISFNIKSDEFSDLKTLTSTLPVKEIIKQWIAYKVEAKRYKLHYLRGKAKIINKEFHLDSSSLEGYAVLKDVTIKYKNELDPILTDNLKLYYRDHALYFDIKDAKYRDRELKDNKLSITNMGKDKIPFLNLNLNIRSEIDDVIHKILKAYNLNIPITQKGKNVYVNLNLTIPLKKKSAKRKKKIETQLKVNLSVGDIYFGKKLKIHVLNGNIEFEKGVVTLHNIHIENKFYSATVNGKIYPKTKKANLKLDIKYFNIGDNKNRYFSIKNKNITLNLDYGKDIIKIPELNIEIIYKKKKNIIKLLDLKTIKPYIKKTYINIDGGTLNIVTEDFKIYNFTGRLKRNSCFFYGEDNICHTIVSCSGTIKKDKFIFNAFNKRLHIDMHKSQINVKNLNIDLTEFFKTKSSNKKKEKINSSKTINIFGEKSKLRYGKYKLITDNYYIKVTPKGDIYANGNLGSDKVKLIKTNNSLTIEAIDIKDSLLHPLINFNGLHNGQYTFKAYGNPNKVMNGEIVINGGIMRNFKAYNNTLAFMNTLPALATFSNPGFSKKGFHIKKGVTKYRKIGDKIIFDSIHIEGTSANIVGSGEIDLKRNTIQINLAIQIARELGKVVGSLPVLGYILMGEDKSMTVGLKITGSLSEPKVETSPAKEFLKLPLDIIERTLKSPSQLIKNN